MKKHIELNNELMQKKDGFYQLEKDKEAVDIFLVEVEEKMKKFDSKENYYKWMIQNDYYVNFLEMYDMNFIGELSKMVYSYEFKFQSYMAVSKFYQSYALKTNDKKGYLEYY